MEKTIRYFLVITIITGAIFSYGCFSDDLYDSDLPEDAKMEEMEDGDEDMEEEGENEEAEEEVEETKAADNAAEASAEAEYVLTDEDKEVVPVTGIAPEENVDEIPVAEENTDTSSDSNTETTTEGSAEATDETASETTVETTTEAETTDAPAEPVSVYQNGTFTVQAPYMSPGGSDDMSVSFTIDNDVVTGVVVTEMAGNGESREYINRFKGAIPGLVVGKNLDEVGPYSKVARASLTTGAFNQAVAAIKAQAKN